MDWFLHDNGLRHERVNNVGKGKNFSSWSEFTDQIFSGELSGVDLAAILRQCVRRCDFIQIRRDWMQIRRLDISKIGKLRFNVNKMGPNTNMTTENN